ncbi:MAG: hypothetical protein J6386_04760 [Candidatus Synoicihabitans palmerolidicus]|nr:hypothetical protein [Candidatus Synoicihabitans palmerolidicus]MCC5022142.1 hypothetical protein [Candidatus Synoicihabitans palmerolidicus]
MLAVAAGVKGLQIVLVGLNYERKDRFRTAVSINVWEAMDANHWWAQHGGEERRARRLLTSELARRLKEVAIHLEEAAWAPLVEEVEGMLPASSGMRVTGLLRLRKRVADAINYFHRLDRPRAEELATRLQVWRDRREAVGLPVDARYFRQSMDRRIVSLAGDAVGLLGALGLGIVGLMYHLVPHGVTRVAAARLDQPGRMTGAFNRILVGVPVYGMWYTASAVWGWHVFQPWVVLGGLVLLPVAGLVAVWFGRRLRTAGPIWLAEARLLGQRSRGRELRAERAALVTSLTDLAEEFPGTVGAQSRRWAVLRPPAWLMVSLTTLAVLAVAGVAAGWLMRDRPLEWWYSDAPALQRVEPEVMVRRVEADEHGFGRGD